MTMKQTDPRKQFSKWLARFGAWAWGVYLLIVAFLIYSRPEAAMPCVWLVVIVTANKMIDTLAYTDNSKTEKILLSALDKAKFELQLKGIGSSSAGSKQKEGSEDEEGLVSEDEGEGESNG